MKKLLFIFLLISGGASAQTPGYFPITVRNEYTAAKFKQIHLPAGCGAPSGLPTGIYRGAGAVFLDSCGNSFYYWRNGIWNAWTAGGGGGSGITQLIAGYGLDGGTITTTGTISFKTALRDSIIGLIPPEFTPSEGYGITITGTYPQMDYDFDSTTVFPDLRATIPAAALTSVFGRTGAVTAQNNDYTFAQIGIKPTTVAGYGITDGVTLTGSETLTNKDLSSGTNTFPTFNQNTTGSAATLTTSRSIYGSSFNGSADLTGPIIGTYGGTGVNNSTRTITIAGNLTHSGSFTQTFVATGNTNVTLPTTGTLATLSGTETMTNKRWTARVGSTTSSATPTINTDNVDIYKLTALAANITSFTTNLSGTPSDGDILEIQITGTATRTIAWGASFASSTVSLPTTTSSTATLTVILQYYTTSSYGNNVWVCANYY